MVISPPIQKAFDTLGISQNTTYEEARAIYKKLALLHHPDRNYGDSAATLKFQQIGEAWDVYQRHFETPQTSQFYPQFDFEEPDEDDLYYDYDSDDNSDGIYYDDDDDSLADSEADLYFRYMFEEVLFGRYTSARGQEYRRTFHTDSKKQYENVDSKLRQEEDRRRQEAQKEAYEERIQELERDIAKEQAENERKAKEHQKSKDQTASAQHRAFTLGRAGDSTGMMNVIQTGKLDVKAPEKLGRHLKTKAEDRRYETMLHVAAVHCKDISLLDFLIQKGADPGASNRDSLTPFHAAILSGNSLSVEWFLQKQRARSMKGCHPSKATEDGRTPLQLGITSGNSEVIKLILKDATVHDVEKWWKTLPTLPQFDETQCTSIKEILATKKGFQLPKNVPSIETEKPSSRNKAKRKKTPPHKPAKGASNDMTNSYQPPKHKYTPRIAYPQNELKTRIHEVKRGYEVVLLP